jgi:hypothetical protein
MIGRKKATVARDPAPRCTGGYRGSPTRCRGCS